MKNINKIAIVVLIIGIGVVVNALSQKLFGKVSIDLTEDRLYSLSEGTKNIVGKINQPISLKFYFSKTELANQPGLKLYGSRVNELLQEYKKIGGDKIDLQVYDVRPDSEEEEWAIKYGLKAASLQSGESVYFGLVLVNSKGVDSSIPFFNFDRQQQLEYDVSKLLSASLENAKPKVAVISGITDIQGEVSQYGVQEDWYFLNQLKESTDLSVLPSKIQDISPDFKLLILIHPKSLGEETLYAIDQFVLGGGNMIALVDPFCQADKGDGSQPGGVSQSKNSSDINKLTETWGLKLISDKVVGDAKYSASVSAGQGGMPIHYPPWMILDKEAVNQENIATNGIDQLLMIYAGAFEVSKVEGVNSEILVKTSKESHLYSKHEVEIPSEQADELLRTFVSDNKEYPLAVLLNGKFKSSFKDGRPASSPDNGGTENASSEQGRAAHLNESKGSSNVIILSDVDLLSNRYSVNEQNFFGNKYVNDNQIIFQNSVENFLGSSDLISLRSRGKFSREFSVVKNMLEQANQQYVQELMYYESKLSSAKTDLEKLLQGTKEGENISVNQEYLDQVKELRQQKAEAQASIRKIKLGLREGIEKLGEKLFILNTFAMPLFLILFYAFSKFEKRKKLKNINLKD